ncbi:MAG: DUF192 domain-containing protein [Bdellovibrionales bacterium]
MKVTFSNLWPRLMMGIIVFGAATLVFALAYSALNAPPVKRPIFERASVTILRNDGATFPLDLEIAHTPEQKAYGLMFLRKLPKNSGMLFLWDQDIMLNMWMKNTYIPLDVGFLDRRGVIIKIITHAVPLDLRQMSSDAPARAVLEIEDGGFTKRGIKAGDRVIFSAFVD